MSRAEGSTGRETKISLTARKENEKGKENEERGDSKTKKETPKKKEPERSAMEGKQTAQKGGNSHTQWGRGGSKDTLRKKRV